MNDDDRTIDADEGVLDDLKRLAAEVRSRQAADDDGGDVTIDADETTMEQLRRFAAEARDAVSDSDDVEPDASVVKDASRALLPPMDDLSPVTAPGSVPAAGEGEAVAPPSYPEPVPAEPRFYPESAPVAPPPFPEPAPVTRRRDQEHPALVEREPLEQLSAPDIVQKGKGWRPPARSVLPVEPDKNVGQKDGPWKAVAAILGLLLAAVAAYVLFGIVTGEDPVEEPPTEEIVPDGSTLVPGGTAGGG